MRGIDTPIRQIRRRVFEEVARVAFESDNLNDDIEALPYIIAPSDLPTYHESIYRERAIVSEREGWPWDFPCGRMMSRCI